MTKAAHVDSIAPLCPAGTHPSHGPFREVLNGGKLLPMCPLAKGVDRALGHGCCRPRWKQASL